MNNQLNSEYEDTPIRNEKTLIITHLTFFNGEFCLSHIYVEKGLK